jgi:hypothetical protein
VLIKIFDDRDCQKQLDSAILFFKQVQMQMHQNKFVFLVDLEEITSWHFSVWLDVLYFSMEG